MPRKIDWERDRKRDLVHMWRSEPLEGPYREPRGLNALRRERELEARLGDVRLEDDRRPETCVLKLAWKSEKWQTVIYHFIGITFAEASAAFPSKAWTEAEVDQVLRQKGWHQDRFQRGHAVERRMDINVSLTRRSSDGKKG